MAGVNMIGNSVGTYQPPAGVYGVPGVAASSGAQAASSSAPSLGGMASSLASMYSAVSGGGGLSAAGQGGMDAAAVQSIQGAPNSQLGNIQRGIGVASLANSAATRMGGGSAGLGAGLGAAGGFLSMYNGVQQGGVRGYGSAVVGGLRAASGIESLLGNSGMAGTLGAAAGYVAAPLAVYSAIKNWKSGATGADTIQGAEAGAAVGSVIPVVGTVIGAVVGGAIGAISSAFGGGSTSTEATQDRTMNATLNNASDAQRAAEISTLTPAQSVQSIQGDMNAHAAGSGGEEGIQAAFGKNGVSNMLTQMMPAINSAIAKNPALGKLSPQQLYTQVVSPWLTSKGATVNAGSKDVKGNTEGSNLADSITNVIGQWQSGTFTSKTPVGVKGQTINIPAYG